MSRKTFAFVAAIFMFIFLAVMAYFSYGKLPLRPPSDKQENEASLPQPVRNQDSQNYLIFTNETYGYSGEKQALQVVKISNSKKEVKKKILCVFAIHGFEDAFYRDGQLLVDIAGNVVDYFKQNPDDLGSYQLLIVPCANPDGLRDGWTCNGPGRCQISQGIDLNMDFDYLFKKRANLRNLTGTRPFTSPEASALKDLVVAEKPYIVIDFHGWVNSASGDPQISKIFCEKAGLSYVPRENTILPGYFSGWAAQYAKTVLVEYPDPFTGQGSYDQQTDYKISYDKGLASRLGFDRKTIDSIKEIITQNL